LIKFIYSIGAYALLLKRTFGKPERSKIIWRRFFEEANSIGIQSLGIVAIVSLFVGAVTCINTAYQLVSALIPDSAIGSVVSESSILELAPVLISLVLAGKVGSNIATELGYMRLTEQIDAIEVMGVNSASYLILPKLLASIIMIPVLIIIGQFLSIIGGIIVGELLGIVGVYDFSIGAIEVFRIKTFIISMVKAFSFSFLISSVAAYQGYTVMGGSREVGEASTRTVVYSCILILLSDYVVAQVFL
jgi:phospholipid/cholesterol/gamma-HCH transport system permease protein